MFSLENLNKCGNDDLVDLSSFTHELHISSDNKLISDVADGKILQHCVYVKNLRGTGKLLKELTSPQIQFDLDDTFQIRIAF